MGYWLSSALFAWVIVAFLQTRQATSQVLIGENPEEVTAAEMRFAQIYPWLAIVLTFLMWCVVEILAGMGRFDLLGGRQYIVLMLIIFTPCPGHHDPRACSPFGTANAGRRANCPGRSLLNQTKLHPYRPDNHVRHCYHYYCRTLGH